MLSFCCFDAFYTDVNFGLEQRHYITMNVQKLEGYGTLNSFHSSRNDANNFIVMSCFLRRKKKKSLQFLILLPPWLSGVVRANTLGLKFHTYLPT